MNKTIARKLF